VTRIKLLYRYDFEAIFAALNERQKRGP